MNAISTGFIVELYSLVKNVCDSAKGSILAKILLERRKAGGLVYPLS